MVEVRGYVKRRLAAAPAEAAPVSSLQGMLKLQYSLHFVGSRRFDRWPEEGNFAGGPSIWVLGAAGMAASVRTRPHVREPIGDSPPWRISSSSERLDYIAAMVQELRIMSAQADYRDLAGILELAYHEALRRAAGG